MEAMPRLWRDDEKKSLGESMYATEPGYGHVLLVLVDTHHQGATPPQRQHY